MFNIDTFQKNEDRIRKQWLISFFILTAVTTLSLIYRCIIVFLYYDKVIGLHEGITPITPLTLIINLSLEPVEIIFWLSITYYFSYKKNGTALLMSTLIYLPFRELRKVTYGWASIIELWDLKTWALNPSRARADRRLLLHFRVRHSYG